jgi:XTP/dITP diphosphohydrolase
MGKLVYATTNSGKVSEVRSYLEECGISLLTLNDLGVPEQEVNETGTTLGENAEIKVHAYLRELKKLPELRGKSVLVLSDDAGLEIDGLGGEPGIYIRRWKDRRRRMTDEEILSYTLERMQYLTKEDRGAQWRCVAAIGKIYPDGTIVRELKKFEGVLRGRILEKPLDVRMKDYPFEPLFFIDKWNMTLAAVHKLTGEVKKQHRTHRTRAIEKALPFLRRQLQ